MQVVFNKKFTYIYRTLTTKDNIMKKSDLKSGMMVTLSKGEDKSLILIDSENGSVMCDMIPNDNYTGGFRHSNYYNLDHFDNDLIEASNDFYGNIIKVHSMYGKLLWERKPEKTIEFDGVEYSESTLRSIIKKATD